MTEILLSIEALPAYMENRVWYLYSKKLTGEATLAETSELNNLLSAQPALHDELAALENFWQAKAEADLSSIESDYRRLVMKMQQSAIPIALSNEAKQPKRLAIKVRPIWYWTAAAASILTFLMFWWTAPENRSSAIAKEVPQAAKANQVSTRPGSRTKIELPDGTQVWLNADSKITYGNDFGTKTRDVTLSGEAYFDVTPNKKIPFFIHTSKIRIKVTGTAFNVRAYPNEHKSETSLVHGKVEVILNSKPDKTYYLEPSEKLVLSEEVLTPVNAATTKDYRIASPQSLEIEPRIAKMVLDDVDQLPIETAWVNNRLVFSDESFREVADKMERWYGTEIVFADPELESIHFTGRFEDETIQEALHAMQLTARFRFQLSGNTIVINKPTK